MLRRACFQLTAVDEKNISTKFNSFSDGFSVLYTCISHELKQKKKIVICIGIVLLNLLNHHAFF